MGNGDGYDIVNAEMFNYRDEGRKMKLAADIRAVKNTADKLVITIVHNEETDGKMVVRIRSA